MEPTFWSRVRRGLFGLLVLLVIVHFLDSRGYLYGPQMAIGPDLMLQKMDANAPIDVSIVTISDADYSNLFCSQSPLDGRAVITLVKKVQAAMQPEVIGVDLDTSDWEPGKIPTSCSKAGDLCTTTLKGVTSVDQACLTEELRKIKGGGSQAEVVWAQIPGVPVAKNETDSWIERQVRKYWEGEREATTILPLRPAAGDTTCLGPAHSGIPMFPLDPDGEVRRYRRRFPIEPLPGCTGATRNHMDSLPHALAKACRTCIDTDWQVASAKNPDESRFLRFAGDKFAFFRADAGSLLTGPVTAVSPRKIVLIGGAYKGARDVYRTPLSRPRSEEMPGVDLLAHAVETDLHGATLELGGPAKLMLDAIAGFLVILLWAASFTFWRISIRKLLLFNLVAISAGFLLLSNLLFSLGLWLDSVAIIVGVVLHQIWSEFEAIEEHKEAIHRRDRQLADKQAEIDALNARLEKHEQTPGQTSQRPTT